ncbi:MAG: UDP-3-O-acyl-N-acetylglucosamine deacetylase [Candidatus Omnitrophica bacterium]|nr:UDP-3-O-acyl-N-acetylglucosamine deacetylase [Candidatus Omnitrophota bacterium]MDD5436748.1 UDP-3-O-acyl-N-acetylglucosamine deacetylase [Candidatus Omnitrophota bacterium]
MTSGPKQRTIAKSVSVEGLGLQTGGKVRLTLKSSPADSGITFVRTDLPDKPSLNLRLLALGSSDAVERRTTLGFGPGQIQTTEHLLAALSGLSIDNIAVELDNTELPGLDGSAKSFVDLIKSSGVVEQEKARNSLKVGRVTACSAKDSLIAVFPDEQFRISYTLSYKDPAIGTQFYSIIVNEKDFETEIAPARTFCLEEEARELLKRGLGKGANYDNTLVIGKAGPVNTALRFPNEPVRHKILDLIGDLYILGMPIMGHVVAIKSGHALNAELVKKLREG